MAGLYLWDIPDSVSCGCLFVLALAGRVLQTYALALRDFVWPKGAETRISWP